MKFSFHVQTIPCPEEYYMGVQADFQAYIVDIPDELFPKELLEILERKTEMQPNGVKTLVVNRTVTSIAPVRESSL